MAPDPDPQQPGPGADIGVQRVRAPASADRLSLLTGLVGLIVALAILKPWGDLGLAPSAPPRVFATATPAPSAEPTEITPEGLADPICLGAGSWQIASLETWRTQDVRVWRALEPSLDAVDPLDPDIPVVPIIAIDVRAVGFCAPSFGPDKPVGPASLTAWWVNDGEALQLGLLQVLPEEGVTPMAGLYRPVFRCPTLVSCGSAGDRARSMQWPTGRVVFRYTDEGTGRVAWFAVDLQVLGEPHEPAPSAPAGG
jgi:hypothetical protein